MVLLVAEDGPLRAAIVSELEGAGMRVATASPDDENLWLAARKQRAIVYLPTPNLLEAQAAPAPSAERMQAVLGASEAPGVEVIVPVFPASDYDAEIRLMKRYGKAYAALRAHPLLEEIAPLLPGGAKSLYLPRAGQARYCRASAVARAVHQAIQTEEQGRVTDVESEVADAALLVRRAAATVQIPVRVRAVRPWLFRLLRPLFRWLRRSEVRLLAALSRLLPEPNSPRAALPAPRS